MASTMARKTESKKEDEKEGKKEGRRGDQVEVVNMTAQPATRASPMKPKDLWSHPTFQPRSSSSSSSLPLANNTDTSVACFPSPPPPPSPLLRPAQLRSVVNACIVEPLRLQIQLIDSAMLLLFRSKLRVNILATGLNSCESTCLWEVDICFMR